MLGKKNKSIQSQPQSELEQIINLKYKVAECNIKLAEFQEYKIRNQELSSTIRHLNQQNSKLLRQLSYNHIQLKKLSKFLNIEVTSNPIDTITNHIYQINAKLKNSTKQLSDLKENYSQLKQQHYRATERNAQQKSQINTLQQKILKLDNLLEEKSIIIKQTLLKLEEKQKEIIKMKIEFNKFDQCMFQKVELEKQLQEKTMQSPEFLEKQLYEMIHSIEVRPEQYLRSYLQKEPLYTREVDNGKKSKYELFFYE